MNASLVLALSICAVALQAPTCSSRRGVRRKAGEDDSVPQPDPIYSDEAVVALCMNALGPNDDPIPDAGLRTCWNFSLESASIFIRRRRRLDGVTPSTRHRRAPRCHYSHRQRHVSSRCGGLTRRLSQVRQEPDLRAAPRPRVVERQARQPHPRDANPRRAHDDDGDGADESRPGAQVPLDASACAQINQRVRFETISRRWRGAPEP